ncbi:DUF3054 domain-containing protein [Leucobacter sp. HY1910]
MAKTPAARPGRPALLTITFAAACDIALVVLFAALGRSEHARDASLLGLGQTAWPFLAGLAIMWLMTLAFRRPLAIVRTGVPVWLGTVAIGMLLRLATGSGTALPFVLVATGTLAVFLLGWRAIAALAARLRRPAA